MVQIEDVILRDIVDDICITAFKISSVIVGLIINYFGYKLFQLNLAKPAGDIEGSYGNYKLKLKNAAPGIFFSLFGSVIIAVTVANSKFVSHSKDIYGSHIEIKDKPPFELPDQPPHEN